MKRRVLFSVVAMATVATVAIAAVPSVGAMGPWGRGPLASTPLGRTITGCVGRLLTLRTDMDVSDEQRKQIREVVLSHRSEIASTAKSVRDKRVVLRDLVRSGDAQESQIRAAADELGQVISDAAVKAAKLRNEIAPLLNEKQHELIDKFFVENDKSVSDFLETAAKGI